MNVILLFFCLISIVYCCDIPAIKGFEVFVNSHDSMLYGVGLSIIAAYVFYVFQVIIPRFLHFRKTRNIGRAKFYDIEESMTKVFSFLQGELYKPINETSKESISNYLNRIDIFTENSRYEIQNHKELSVFEAIVYYDTKIMFLIEEILSGQYLETKYEKILLKLKISKMHSVVVEWNSNLPGEYERYNTNTRKIMRTGYNSVNNQAVNSDFVFAIDEYLKIYSQIKKSCEELYHK